MTPVDEVASHALAFILECGMAIVRQISIALQGGWALVSAVSTQAKGRVDLSPVVRSAGKPAYLSALSIHCFQLTLLIAKGRSLM